MGEQKILKKKRTRVGEKNRRVSEAEPNTQSEEAFMIDRLGAFLIFIAAFFLKRTQLGRVWVNGCKGERVLCFDSV
jgi:hypothetical protein